MTQTPTPTLHSMNYRTGGIQTSIRLCQICRHAQRTDETCQRTGEVWRCAINNAVVSRNGHCDQFERRAS